jgi:Heterokaryon incompatibility protein Het-C/Domain of unknown function (DUF4157)
VASEHDHQEAVAAEPPAAAQAPASAGFSPLAPSPQRILALQRSAGNAAVTSLLRAQSGSAGVPLPPSAAAAASVLGPAAPEVRLHRGAEASRRLAKRPDALAVTEGTDIHLAAHAPPLESAGGRLLLAHEAAHVVQQRSPGGELGTDSAEAEADEAAVAASLGRPVSVQQAARGPQYFEAPKHAATLKVAMDKAGFSDAEQDAAYFGNWCRDLSQALVPTLDEILGHNATFQAVNMLAIRHFGHGVTPSQLGAYSPREHIDNPAGTIDKDILDAPKRVIEGYPDTADPITGKPQNVAGASGGDGKDAGEDLKPENIAKSFEVNAAGIPAYIERSRAYIMEEYGLAAEAGRNEKGLYHLGNFSHTCEDLFAHSNWAEAAVGRLIGEGKIQIPPDVQEDVTARMAAGKPPVEDYSAQAVDKAGNTRPILATGTFTGGSATGDRTGHDTFISLTEELKNLVEELDPFKDEGDKASNWDFLMEILNHMDAAAEEGTLGAIVAGMMDPLVEEIDKLAEKATGAADSLEGKARGTFGEGTMGDLAAGAASLVGKGVHAVADPLAAAGKEGAKSLIKSFVDAIGKSGIKLAEIAVWYQKGEAWVAEKWKAFKEGIKELPEFLRELILPKVVEAERAFKKEVKKLGSAIYDKATRSLLAKLSGSKKETKVEATNVDAKYHEWAKGLSKYMKDALSKVGGPDGDALAKDIPTGENEKDIPTLITYAESTFPGVLRGLASAAEADSVAEMLDKTGTQARQVKQLSNVPEWARAGASHSQTAKDHKTSPFFGIAFSVANKADTILVGLMKATWDEMGQTGPANEKLAENYGEKDAKGKQKMGEEEPGKEARPVLKNEEGLSEWEKEARRKFLENRVEGEQTVKDGVAPDEKIGTALTGMADRLVKIVQAYPFIGPAFDKLIAAIRSDPENAQIVALVDEAQKEFDTYANSGQLDDDAMDEVDTLLARAKGLALGKAKEEADHKAHEAAGGGDVHTAKQIALLDQHRGTEGDWKAHKAKRETTADGKSQYVGVAVDSLNKTVKVGDKAAADLAAEKAVGAKDKFKAEVDRIFGHPYDSNWWVDTVQEWATKHQVELADYIKDRNSGKSDVH